MQLTTQLAQIIESGKVTLYVGNVKDLEVKVANKEIDINAINKAFVKDLFSSIRGNSNKSSQVKAKKGTEKLKNIRNLLDTFKGTAEELDNVGITVTISYKGDTVITIGEKADPKLSLFLTGKAIQVNNLFKLIEMAI